MLRARRREPIWHRDTAASMQGQANIRALQGRRLKAEKTYFVVPVGMNGMNRVAYLSVSEAEAEKW